MNVTEALRLLLDQIDYTQPETGAHPNHLLCARVCPDDLEICREALDGEAIPVPDENPKQPDDSTPVFAAMGLEQPPLPEAPIVTGYLPPLPTTDELISGGDPEQWVGQGGTFGGAGATVEWDGEPERDPSRTTNTGAGNDIDTAGGQAIDTGPNPDYSASVDSNSGLVSQDSGF